jgi:UDP-N-acetylglucosamine--N-acetylmuramyl-(pentapeptide) pyrophosphoryl-undecaprenol N-acetylglucosamine transferase
VRRGHKVVWIGHKQSSRGDAHESAEYLEVTSSQISFYDLNAGKLILNLSELIRFPVGISKAISLLRHIKPHAVLSFGGYLGGTVTIAGKLLGVPIYLHEQTVTAGRANKLIARLARVVYLTYPDSAKHLSAKCIEVVGLPLRSSIVTGKPKSFFSRKRPTLLVMGGKQGAHILNQFIFAHLSDLLTHFNIIHQTGTNSKTQDCERACALQNSLASLADCYLPRGYIGESEIGAYLASTQLYFGRSGAHICYELGVLGLPAVLVPLMSTHDAEQLKNARILESAGLALILPQSRLTLPAFTQAVTELKKLKGTKLPLPVDATQVLVDHLLKQLG